jgi:hypothetical protein
MSATTEDETYKKLNNDYDIYHKWAGKCTLAFIVCVCFVVLSIFVMKDSNQKNCKLGVTVFLMVCALAVYFTFFSFELLKLSTSAKMNDLASDAIGIRMKWNWEMIKLKYEILAIQTFAVVLFTYFLILSWIAARNNKGCVGGFTRITAMIPALFIAVYASVKYDQHWR